MWIQCPNPTCKLVQQSAPVCNHCGQALPAAPAPPPPPVPAAEAGWFYLRDGRQVGPLPFDDLCAFARGGTLAPADHVWQQGTPAWVTAGSVPGLFPHPAPNPPPPPPPAPAAEPGLTPYLPLGAHVRSQRFRTRAWQWAAVALVVNGLTIWYVSSLQGSARAARERQAKADQARAAWSEQVKAVQAKHAEKEAQLRKEVGGWEKHIMGLANMRMRLHFQRDLDAANNRLKAHQDRPLELPPEPPPPDGPTPEDVARKRPRALAFLLGCDLVVFPSLVGLQVWRWRRLRRQEIAYGVEWAGFLSRSNLAREGWRDPAARGDWAVIPHPESPGHLRQLLTLIPPEPKALYLELKGATLRTCTLPPGKEAKELAADFLRFLLFRNLLALELPASSQGWGSIDGERAGIFRVDLNESVRLEVYVVVRVEGNVLSLLQANHVLWLYPEEAPNALACAKRVRGSVYTVSQGAPQYLDVSYGHTAVWVRANVVRDRPEGYHPPWFFGGLITRLNDTEAAKARALVSKIEAEVEEALSEFTPTPEFRGAAPGPAPRPNTSW